ncbi:sugar phosphate isomerase/epimerase family protein [Streptomyces asiaticus]
MSLLQQRTPFFAHPHLTGSVWPEKVRDSFADRVAAVAAVGAPGMGMGGYELEELLATHSLDELRGILDEHGVRIGEIELLLGWHADGEEGEQARRSEEQLFSWAEAFSAERIKTSAVFIPPAEMSPVDLLVERFAALCDRAAERGLTVELEPFAVFPAFHYGVAADVVIAADRPNGGLLIDTWHLFRDPHGLAALERVEGRHITGVELCDGAAEPVGTLQEDCVISRLLPGEGVFDLACVLRTLDTKGVDVTLSTEVLSEDLRRLTPKEVTTRTIAAFRSLLQAVQAS